MVIIRLTRRGSKNRPHYGIMVADRKMPRDGRFLEEVGIYDPRKLSETPKLNLERIKHWLMHGAQTSPTVKYLIKKIIKKNIQS